jgi:predicted nucleic acid-binding protein
MLVVADTSPINYLVLADQIEILPRLYGRILVPPAVVEELKHPAAPKPVRDWVDDLPGWVEVQRPQNALNLAQLDLGESEAIALATEMRAALLLIDDQAGRQEAVRRGLRIAGTLAVLDEADRAGLLDFKLVLARILQIGFRVSKAVLAEINERRSR